MSYRSCISVLVFSLSILDFYDVNAAKDDFTRQVSVYHNPGCDIAECKGANATKSSVNLIYAKAQGTNDSLHYILSTVGRSSPTLLLLRSDDADAILKINWTNFVRSEIDKIHGSVQLVSQVHGDKAETSAESVIILDRLLEYNDSTDEANMPNNASQQFNPILLKQVEWEVNMTDTLRPHILGTSEQYPNTFSSNSSVSIDFMPFGSTGQTEVLPSLPHTANSSEWEFNLDSLLSRGNGSRFAIEMLLFEFGTNISKLRSKSINDEYCPSIFTLEKIEWSGPTSDNHEEQNTLTYHQWRSVSYSSVQHERKLATDVKTSDFTSFNSSSERYADIASNRLLQAYFGSQKLNTSAMQSVIVSFGEAEDGFYAATNYTSWTSSIGFGAPPIDEFSILVICMLVAGVGCPLLVILLGGVYVTWVRIKRSKRGIKKKLVTNYDYEPIET